LRRDLLTGRAWTAARVSGVMADEPGSAIIVPVAPAVIAVRP